MAAAGSTLHVPSSTLKLIPRSDFERSYGSFQVLHLRGVSASPTQTACGAENERFQASAVQSMYASLDDRDKLSWCIENNDSTPNSMEEACQEKPPATPDEFLDVNNTNLRGYCSFLVQHSKAVKENLLIKSLPMAHLPVTNGSLSESNSESGSIGKNDTMKVRYGPCIWLFFGRNHHSEGDRASVLPGRPEHTDSVTHDGTWHYQLSGTKIWCLRPTTELLQKLKENEVKNEKCEQTLAGAKRKFDTSGGCNEEVDATKNYFEVECNQGDVLVINTRLWWHSTYIPPQSVPSISYARDFIFKTAEDTDDEETEDTCNIEKKKAEQDAKEEGISELVSAMNNVDGTYAAENIAADTILFTEHTMPNCELHRSKTNPNCQVVELEDDEGGESYMAVVSLRYIKAGEFFSILASSDEEEEGVESEEGEEEEELSSRVDDEEEDDPA